MTNEKNPNDRPRFGGISFRRMAHCLLISVVVLVVGAYAVTLDDATLIVDDSSLTERLVNGWDHHPSALSALAVCSLLLSVGYSARRKERDIILPLGVDPSMIKEPVSKLKDETGDSDGSSIHPSPSAHSADSSQPNPGGHSRLQELRETTTNIFDLYDLSPVPFFLIDTEGDICSANDQAARLLGISKRKLTGQRLADLAATKEVGESATTFILKRSAAGNTTHEREIEMLPAGQPAIWVSLSSRPVLDRQGCVLLTGVTAVNVTERKIAEAALRESEERFRRTFDESPIGAAMVSLDNCFVRVNSELCCITGYAENELTALGWANVVHPENLDEILSSATKLLDGDIKQFAMDCRLVRKNGATVWVRQSVRLMKNSLGDPAYFLPMVEDITMRKGAEQEMRFSEERFRLLYENSPVPYQSLSVDGTLVEINDAWCQAFGYEKNEVIGRPMVDFLTKESGALFQNCFREFKTTGKVSGQELEIVSRDSTVKTVSVDGRAHFDKEGIFDRSHCVFWDITERKAAEAKIRESEQVYRTLVDTMNEGIIMRDSAGGITYVNKRACVLLGASSGDLVGKSVFGFLRGQNRKIMEAMVKQASDGVSGPFELTWRRADGKPVATVVAPASVAASEGNKATSILVITDVTHLKKTEAMLKQTGQTLEMQRQKLDQKDTALKQVFEHLEGEKAAYKKNICSDIELEMRPLLRSIKSASPSDHRQRVDQAGRKLKLLLNQDIDTFAKRFADLTPREREVCRLIRNGMSSKEMSEQLNLSLLTIHKHRENIRNKLNVKNKSVNLSTYLHFR